MIIRVASRFNVNKTINTFEDKLNINVISITDPGSEYCSIDLSDHHVLRIGFHDVEENYPSKYVTKFSMKHALEIRGFINRRLLSPMLIVRKSRYVPVIIVHCEAGVSRSPAIAAALSILYQPRNSYEFFFHNYYPNRHVFKTMCAALQVELPKNLPGHSRMSDDYFDQEN